MLLFRNTFLEVLSIFYILIIFLFLGIFRNEKKWEKKRKELKFYYSLIRFIFLSFIFFRYLYLLIFLFYGGDWR